MFEKEARISCDCTALGGCAELEDARDESSSSLALANIASFTSCDSFGHEGKWLFIDPVEVELTRMSAAQ